MIVGKRVDGGGGGWCWYGGDGGCGISGCSKGGGDSGGISGCGKDEDTGSGGWEDEDDGVCDNNGNASDDEDVVVADEDDNVVVVNNEEDDVGVDVVVGDADDDMWAWSCDLRGQYGAGGDSKVMKVFTTSAYDRLCGEIDGWLGGSEWLIDDCWMVGSGRLSQKPANVEIVGSIGDGDGDIGVVWDGKDDGDGDSGVVWGGKDDDMDVSSLILLQMAEANLWFPYWFRCK